MAAPVVTSITPNSGLAVGDVFVKIVGTGFNLAAVGSVSVTFGGVAALRVGVVSATLVMAVAPRGDPDAGLIPGAVDVVVANVTPQVSPTPPLVEPTTVTNGFRYRRPSIATPNDLSNHGAIALVTRTLVSEFQRAVLKNARHDVHPDFASAVDAAATPPLTQQATAPSLKILGPKIVEDRWNSRNEPLELDAGSGNWTETFPSKTVLLTYDVVGIGRDYGEASNLWQEVQRYFVHNDHLLVSITSSALGGEVASYELEGLWDSEGEFRSHATRQGLEQFTLTFVVRGVTINPDAQSWASFELDQINLEFFQLPAPDLAPFDGVPVETLEVMLPSGQDLRTTLADLEARLEHVEADDPPSVAYAFNTASPLLLVTLLPGDIVTEVKVVVSVPFDQAATILIGTTAVPDLILGAGEIASQVAGETASEADFKIVNQTGLVLSIAPAGSAVGSGFVLFRVRR